MSSMAKVKPGPIIPRKNLIAIYLKNSHQQDHKLKKEENSIKIITQ